MDIRFDDDVKRQAIASIQRYVREELDQDIGELKAELMLEFFTKELAPTVYNQAIGDAQAFMRQRIDDLEATCFVGEFAYWKDGNRAVRRGRR